jgi:uncharacterized membrane protein (DUF485 family)
LQSQNIKKTSKQKPKETNLEKQEQLQSETKVNEVAQKTPFLSRKVRHFFLVIWVIFLFLFFTYALLVSFAPKIETIATFPR